MAIVTSARPAPTTVPPVLPPPYVVPHRIRLVDRFARYSILVAIVSPTVGIALAIATLRRQGVDDRMRRHARSALVVAVGALLAYTLVLIWLLQILFALVAELVALRG